MHLGSHTGNDCNEAGAEVEYETNLNPVYVVISTFRFLRGCYGERNQSFIPGSNDFRNTDIQADRRPGQPDGGQRLPETRGRITLGTPGSK